MIDKFLDWWEIVPAGWGTTHGGIVIMGVMIGVIFILELVHWIRKKESYFF